MLLHRVTRAMVDRFHDRLEAEDCPPLRPAHGYTFRFVAGQDLVTTVDLGTHLGVTKQAAAKIVAELEGWGYLARAAHPTDGRAQVLRLTQQGWDYLAYADRVWGEIAAEWGGVIGGERLTALRADLQSYLDTFASGRNNLRPVW
ncbi:MarR family winged helix-turn-helix transcriptional regulator [Longispora albida]|uniref:MarR family winged helix-turn-helix transcriptional regulator n=1 Tax=Longispora albida TaxID=203523 RepID=UPI00036D7B93|nr:MarR family transcriptional regulator [Longispora albida]